MFEANRLIKAVGAVFFILMLAGAAQAQTTPAAPPALSRIKIATIAAPDPQTVADAYVKWLGYSVRMTGQVSEPMAANWGTPKMAGKTYFMMSADSNPDVYIRVVAIDPVPLYRASTTSGWNSIEIIVDNIDRLYADLKTSPFAVKAPPSSGVKGFPTIKSMQAEGPAHETLFFTSETGDRAKSILSPPGGQVDRPFVVWLSGPDILRVRDWYANIFAMEPKPIIDKPIEGGTMPNTVLLMKERGNLLQFEGNPAQFSPRPHAAGQLPPGNAMASFSLNSMEGLGLTFISPPKMLYGGTRTATVLDPAGNRVELMEEKRP